MSKKRYERQMYEMDLEGFSEIFNNMKHRAVSLR